METAADNLPEYSVSEISQTLKRTVERAFDRVRVRGEISRPTRAASGHVYLTLKDDSAVLDAICWRGQAQRLSVQPEEGLEVIVTGKLTTYPGRSKYQIIIDSMEVAGEGALLKLLEDRRRKLAGEGLFDDSRKQALPFLPAVIGVVTSPTGAVIRDILHRLSDRFPVHVLVAPVLVQGDGAKHQIAAAIAGFNALAPGRAVPRPDLLIVARGGGSLEDLWAFNEEEVVRAAAASTIPLISAVGHETDTTLIDFASDRRAPTPTAAAEMAVPVRAELIAQVMDNAARLFNAMRRRLGEDDTRLRSAGRALLDPGRVIEQKAQRLDYAVANADRLVDRWLERGGFRVSDLAARLISPVQRLNLNTTRLDGAARGLAAGLRQALRGGDLRLAAMSHRLRLDAVDRRLTDGAARLAEATGRIDPAARRRLDEMGRALTQTARLLDSHSVDRVLEKGFVRVDDATGAPLLDAAATRPGQAVTLHFRDGKRAAVIDGAPAPAPAKRRPKSAKDSQESLF